MRLDSNYVRLHIVEELESTPFAEVRYDDFDIIVVDLPDGKAAAICLMEREMPVHELLGIYRTNQRDGLHTVFILWCEMNLPNHLDIFEPSPTLKALHALHHQKIYAYKTVGDEVYIFPVTFERVGHGPERLVRHGGLIDVKDLGCATIKITGGEVEGTWAMADFTPGRGQENTQRVYRARWEQEARRQKQQEQGKEEGYREPEPARALLYHYTVLGVAIDADWDEVKTAYRKLARKYHPDLNTAPGAKDRMQQINAAYRHLMRHYDDGSAA
jgi:hypothetical protein